MRTAQVIRRLNFNEWGGTENVVWNTSRVLNASGSPTEILATRALGGAERETADGIPVRRFSYFYPWFPLSGAKRAALDKKGGNPLVPGLEHYLKSQDFDLIHCHNLGRLAELSARAAQKRGIPLILSMHGGCLDVPEAERRELVAPFRHTIPYGGIVERLLHLRRDAVAQADGIICVGENEYDAFRERFPEKKICFLPNGVSPEKFTRESAFDWRTELKLAPGTKLLLNVSRIDYQKNQLLLLDLLAALRGEGEPAHLLLIGPVSADWYFRRLNERIDELSLRGCVTVIPGLPPDDPKLIAAYRQADVFLLPSNHEPFGIVVLEAWSAGLPVIASDAGGLGRLVRDGVNGVRFHAGSLDSLLDAWRRMSAVAGSVRAVGKEEVAHNYDWKIIGAKLLDFYAEVCRG